jgi:N-acetylglucosaminyldiphosphoundecaprenol N-acetyl-beta-D-mannosaminyltransferase
MININDIKYGIKTALISKYQLEQLMKTVNLLNTTKSKVINTPSIFGCLSAAFIVTIFTPIYFLNVLISFQKRKHPLCHRTTHDLLGNPYHYLIFSHGWFRHSIILLLIVKNEMSWVGLPREVKSNSNLNGFSEMKLGLVSLYGLHQLTGLSITTAKEDTLLQSKYSTLKKMALLARYFIASLAFDKSVSSNASLKIFGLRIDNVTLNYAVTKILSTSSQSYAKTAGFVNANSINLACNNKALKSAINDLDFAFADGSGVRLAAQVQGDRLVANVNGTDMLPVLCKQAVKNNQSLFLLGSASDVARLTAENLKQEFPGLLISGTHHGYFDKNNNQEIINKINHAKTDILLVALGSPTQECWLQENKMMLKVNTAIAVGGLFDFYSGRISRAPVWMRELGMEWVWRLMKEPKNKFHRYVIGNPIFIFRCFFQS